MSKHRRKGLISPIESRTGGAGSRGSNHSQAPKLKLDGVELDMDALGTVATRIAAFLRTLPPDEIVSGIEMSKRTGIAESSIRRARQDLQGSHAELYGRTVWGSKAALADLQRRLVARA